jgi:hypothetical protein
MAQLASSPAPQREVYGAGQQHAKHDYAAGGEDGNIGRNEDEGTPIELRIKLVFGVVVEVGRAIGSGSSQGHFGSSSCQRFELNAEPAAPAITASMNSWNVTVPFPGQPAGSVRASRLGTKVLGSGRHSHSLTAARSPIFVRFSKSPGGSVPFQKPPL